MTEPTMTVTPGREEFLALADEIEDRNSINDERISEIYVTGKTRALIVAALRLAAKPAEASEPANGLPTLDEYRENFIKEAANCVPTNWCDALLAGPDAPRNLPFSNRDVEQLLRGIQDRIRALSTTTGEPKR